jgi:hypothetical protein
MTRTTIGHATERAKALGVEVRWHKMPNANVLICDPDAGGHVRFELVLPFVPADARPSVRVEHREEPAVVAAAIAMFDKLWADAEVPALETDT